MFLHAEVSSSNYPLASKNAAFTSVPFVCDSQSSASVNCENLDYASSHGVTQNGVVKSESKEGVVITPRSLYTTAKMGKVVQNTTSHQSQYSVDSPRFHISLLPSSANSGEVNFVS